MFLSRLWQDNNDCGRIRPNRSKNFADLFAKAERFTTDLTCNLSSHVANCTEIADFRQLLLVVAGEMALLAPPA